MGNSQAAISRKSFLQLAGLAGVAGSLPRRLNNLMDLTSAWPVISLKQLPEQMQAILLRVPRLEVDSDGYLTLQANQVSGRVRIPQVQTQWNQEHSNRWDRLASDAAWGIVLHWYGDDTGFDQTVEGYLRGFNALRQVADYTTRTSAHVLIGGDFPQPGAGDENDAVTILQTQRSDADGQPFCASHLQQLNYQAHQEKQQYFVRALYELNYQEPTIHSILQDWFDGSNVDPNMCSLAVELTGCNFDDPDHSPTNQQIANTVGVVWALMLRYGVRASNILGHHEIQLDKPDPGKRFISLIRCLLGAKALIENHPAMNELVFGQHLNPEQDPIQAVQIYLKWVRDYLVLVDRPSKVYAWEAESGYWFLTDVVSGESMPVMTDLTPPLPGAFLQPLADFGTEGNHAGVDFYLQNRPQEQLNPRLVSNGKCLYFGDSHGFHPGKQAIFLHRQPDGSDVLSIYGNLSSLHDLQVEMIYPTGYPIGVINNNQAEVRLLHFAIAYRAAWEQSLSANPDAAYVADSNWVRENYMDPVEYLHHQMSLSKPAFKDRIINLPQ